MLDVKSRPIEIKSGSYIECNKCQYTRGPFFSEYGVEYTCQRCYNDLFYCCNGAWPRVISELPDEIILLIMQATCSSTSMKTIKLVKWIFQLGSVSKQFKRAENHFWRKVVDSNPFFSSKLKLSNKHKVGFERFFKVLLTLLR